MESIAYTLTKAGKHGILPLVPALCIGGTQQLVRTAIGCVPTWFSILQKGHLIVRVERKTGPFPQCGSDSF